MLRSGPVSTTQPVNTTPLFKQLGEELYPLRRKPFKTKRDLSTALLSLKPRWLLWHKGLEYTFSIPTSNKEDDVVCVIAFDKYGLGGTINGLPMLECISALDALKLRYYLYPFHHP